MTEQPEVNFTVEKVVYGTEVEYMDPSYYNPIAVKIYDDDNDIRISDGDESVLLDRDALISALKVLKLV